VREAAYAIQTMILLIRVEEGRGYRHKGPPRFPSPLIEPDVRITASGSPTGFISRPMEETPHGRCVGGVATMSTEDYMGGSFLHW